MKFRPMLLIFLMLLPGRFGTQAQANQAYPVISPDNVAQLTLVAELPMSGSMAWSPDGTTLAVNSGGNVLLYSLDDLDSPPALVEGDFWIIAYKPDGTLIGLQRGETSTTGSILFDVVDVQSGETLVAIQIQSEFVTSPVFNPEGTLFAFGDDQYGIQVWDVATGTLLGTLAGHEVPPSTLAFSADSRWLASGAGTGDHHVFLWDVALLAPLRMLSPALPDIDVPAEVLAFSPDKRWLVAGTEQGQPLVGWNLQNVLAETAADTAPEILIDGLSGVFQVAFSPDSRLLAVGFYPISAAPSSVVVRLLDTATNATLGEWGDFPDGIAALSFSADGTLLATVGYDRSVIQLWGIAVTN